MKTLKPLLLAFVIILFLRIESIAQQDAQFSNYMFNGLYYNPGYAGIEGVTRGTLITRKQWLGYDNSANNVEKGNGTSPTSMVLSVNSRLPFLKSRTGAGANIVYDSRGPITTYQVQLALAYHIKIGTGLLGVGVNGGVYGQRIDATYRVTDQSDAVYQYLQNNGGQALKPDFSVGLWYQTTKWYAGASLNHLSQSKFTYGTGNLNSSNLVDHHMYFTGGYTFKPSPSLEITPTALIQTDLKQFTFLVGPMVTYNSKFWVGVNGRQSIAKKDINAGGGKTWSFDDVIIYAGINLMKDNRLKLGFAFDLVTSGTNAKTATSHEVMLSYMLPAPGATPKPKVRTPRYRHDEN